MATPGSAICIKTQLGAMRQTVMTRYHLAAARYQKLGATASKMKLSALTLATEQVAESTDISLTEAIAFSSFSAIVRGRLEELQIQVSLSSE